MGAFQQYVNQYGDVQDADPAISIDVGTINIEFNLFFLSVCIQQEIDESNRIADAQRTITIHIT